MIRPVAAALTLGLALTVTPAHADPAMMTHTEWGKVSAGQTKAKVAAICACTGVKTSYTATYHGNTYRSFLYLTPSGKAYVMFRRNASGTWVVGYERYWCDGQPDIITIPDGQCQAAWT